MTWGDVLGAEKAQPYFKALLAKVAEARQHAVVYPPEKDVFNAFALTPLASVKVVILGQDPYHGPNQAHGLCFSVPKGVKTPPSLRNIYKELADDIPGFCIPEHGNLSHWARQGVLLLNTVLTVEQGKAHSHAHLGWERFTDAVVQVINVHTENAVFLLWGSHAHKKGANINRQRHLVLSAPHPSPLSAHRGFFGCHHFSQTNQWLQAHNKATINW
ncbi:uracil-DNA glycosylase [Aestuariibacter sp. A3R04]|uniref:uracil-DNA glycosylase n=1 Tax=Aestuariibacter sp. A3R04 TaxID=2841571 RepID=UPI001C084C8F|nr:uracil-DNA glycosylase [Aestuariibacter sp. A3R04]MBU3021478.1 uracil-DNA glycosylase [Aestuariibacter sp. A3R04]